LRIPLEQLDPKGAGSVPHRAHVYPHHRMRSKTPAHYEVQSLKQTKQTTRDVSPLCSSGRARRPPHPVRISTPTLFLRSLRLVGRHLLDASVITIHYGMDLARTHIGYDAPPNLNTLCSTPLSLPEPAFWSASSSPILSSQNGTYASSLDPCP
jgi:hypothetical protein